MIRVTALCLSIHYDSRSDMFFCLPGFGDFPLAFFLGQFLNVLFAALPLGPPYAVALINIGYDQEHVLSLLNCVVRSGRPSSFGLFPLDFGLGF